MNTENKPAIQQIADTMEGFTVLQRVKFELGNKQYYSDLEYQLVIKENHLIPDAIYNKEKDQRNMLEAVYSILQTLCNDIDIYRKIETEFATEDQAYKYLQLRLQDIQVRIETLTDLDKEDTNISYMFCN
ncbi:hypothetical protein [Lactonifactor longoviformis]|uniref:hypothetical protein n=1 Tax=Lactonifactor longoviformis TaxID=341220 RepID=UPI0036F3AFF3